MQIPKDQIIQFLMSRGDNDKAQEANGQLPDQVDTDQHGDLLQKFGVNPQELLGKLGGGGGGGLGDVAGKIGL
jgi:hypothetical protein